VSKVTLGISAFYHDSAAALIIDEEIVAAAQEERFTRDKNTNDFPIHAIEFCLQEANVEINEIDAIVFYDKPFLKFERLLQTYYNFAPKGLLSFLTSIPVWIGEKFFMKRLIIKELSAHFNFDPKELKILFSYHHLSHAASSYYPSTFDDAAILTVDAVGEWATATISSGKGSEITLEKEMGFPHSIGLLYSSATYFLGFEVNSGEYKMMGLAPYGDKNADETQLFISQIKSQLIEIKMDGSIWMDQSYFKYAYGLKMIQTSKWESLFGIKKREAEHKLTATHCNLALAFQIVTEDIIEQMAIEAKRITQSNNLCLAGGVALNCVANGKLLEKNIFENIFIPPSPGDAGAALGAALATQYIYFDIPRTTKANRLNGSFLGPKFSDMDIHSMNKEHGFKAKKFNSTEDLIKETATKLAEGNIIGWFQNRMEFGPRSLGNRSILANPTLPKMQSKINLSIKFRENFRPFAPSVLKEYASQYFDINVDSNFMEFVTKLNPKQLTELPSDFQTYSMSQKLAFVKSTIPAVTHIDQTARVQVINKETNGLYWSLISKFNEITGVPLIVNTSFNVRDEPIVCTPSDAYNCFIKTDMDYLVIGNYFYSKINL
jgi:carbamoyltransferase